MACFKLIVCGTDGFTAIAVTPGAGVPTAGYGNWSDALAGGSVGMADGAIVGTGIGVGIDELPAGPGVGRVEGGAAGCARTSCGDQAEAKSSAATDAAIRCRRIIG
ncbi:MAG: hypothetical protein ACREML_08675 [Vulcanimicrobiaceae bacterium]